MLVEALAVVETGDDEGVFGAGLRRNRDRAGQRGGRDGDAGLDRAAAGERLRRQKAAGRLRDDVTGQILQDYLELVLDGLITRVAGGADTSNLAAVLDLVEESVRKPDGE